MMAPGLSHIGQQSEEQGSTLSSRFFMASELAGTGQQAGGQRWRVVARV